MTSRETQRWIIPKGWPWADASDWESAAGEAMEEAGIKGQVEQIGFARYSYQKRTVEGTTELAVDVFLMWVTHELEMWPEKSERKRTWCAPSAAAEMVEEPQLKAILRALDHLPRTRGSSR